ncbi:hypothetical protein EI546_14740 [Aequorivita sp. H23M31]|uniref:UDP-3-O-(3-hydroxymyristoyl)glucosamine N-acyltransferase n=1 Tax=Aequorivita ciconiae TaxID=2494375 RepID=A0A410G6H8_9FLAO|nr:hypothetical protein [Aequorivita sp. H23M31]QAA82898.1 hypothetical protein EI546_14740 [Aequorivita sp. H23M31]
MNPIHFFCSNRIIRENKFSFTYAVGQELDNSIAFANDRKSLNALNNIPSVSVIITTEELANVVSEEKGLILSENPKKDFFLLHNYMIKENHISALNGNDIDESAVIAPTARIGNNVIIGKNVTIDDYTIIESNTVIGDDCEIGPFVVIGTTSLQRTLIDGRLFRLEFAGGVKIGDRSRVLTGAIIQKPYQAFYTTVGEDSVISTRVIVGHGSKVGNRTLMSGGAGIAGNCILGDDVWIGSGAIVADNLKIGDKAKVLLGSVVVRDVGPNEVVSGNFALDHKKNIRQHIKIRD